MRNDNDFGFIEVDVNILNEHAVKEKPPRRMSRTPAVWVTLKPGASVRVRILPPWTNQGPNAFKPYYRIAQHWDVGPEGKRVICPRKMSDGEKECYVCEQIDALYQTGDPIDEKRAQRMRAGQSFIYQVIERGNEFWVETDEALEENPSLLGKAKIQFLRLPWDAHKDFLGFFTDSNYGNFTHARTGMDFVINREGSGLDTTYGVKGVMINGSLYKAPIFGTPGEPDMVHIKELLEDLYNLDEHPFFKTNTYDETVALFKGQDPKEYQALQKSSNSTKSNTMMLSPKKETDTLQAWITEANKHPLMNRSQVAEWGSQAYNQKWTEKSIAPCYGVEPDHEDEGCIACPVHGPCAKLFASTQNKYSVSEEVPIVSNMMGKKSSKVLASPVKEEKAEDGVDDMVSFLEKQSKG